METKHTKESILDGFKIGMWSILTIAPNPFRIATVIISILLSALLIGLVCFFDIDAFEIINDIQIQSISFIPNILGFTIGGYAFLIGFNGSSMLNKISEPLEGSRFTLYQQASASFALNILIQAFTLLYNYFIHFSILLDRNGRITQTLSSSYISAINLMVLFFSIFLIVLSLFMVLQIVFNIFNFSQLYHYSINKEKLDSMPPKLPNPDAEH